jgi:Rrf2 family nitric oxide-sensitive transcriptional repressor
VLSQTSIHVIRALVFLAVQNRNNPLEYVGAGAVAQKIRAPRNYLGKVLQQFVSEGLLESQRGAAGGIRLAMPADRISLYEVVNRIEHLDAQPECFVGRLCCGPEKCRHHDVWNKLHQDYVRFLSGISIEDLVVQNSLNDGRFCLPETER